MADTAAAYARVGRWRAAILRACARSARQLRPGRRDEREDLAWRRQALQVVRAAILEGESGAVEQVLRGAGDKDLPGTGQGGDPRRRVHGEAAWVAGHQLDLAGVKAGADPEAEVGDRGAHAGRAR